MMWWHWKRRGERPTGHAETKFKEPFLDFMDLYSGASMGIGRILPKRYYEQMGPASFKERPLGAGPFKFVS
jgi:hypothetical protein